MESIPIRNPFPGAVSLVVASTESTQAAAKRLAENRFLPGQGFPPGSLIAAEAQTAGRGRFPERRWESEAGKNLLFTLFLDSVVLRLPEGKPLPGLPIRIGSALCEAVAIYTPAPRLKWPNDLMIGDRKAAGILCESGPSGVFAGIGLNCNQVVFPSGLDAKATSLARELGREVNRWALLELFLEALASSLVDANWRRRADAWLWMKGETLCFLPGLEGSAEGGEALIGKFEGIDEEGSILLREEGAAVARAYASGELRAGNSVDRRPPIL
ncbi:MAG: biotin--[acetyl-CoA-carboxylase] ligase [Rectinemataceae bacterium]|jgi:BirA family biotin operon repressor/biotin-[acetyl-CoA-carboxylase] ligase